MELEVVCGVDEDVFDMGRELGIVQEGFEWRGPAHPTITAAAVQTIVRGALEVNVVD